AFTATACLAHLTAGRTLRTGAPTNDVGSGRTRKGRSGAAPNRCALDLHQGMEQYHRPMGLPPDCRQSQSRTPYRCSSTAAKWFDVHDAPTDQLARLARKCGPFNQASVNKEHYMLYHVDFRIEYPASMSQKDFLSIWAREADAALGAKKAGVVVDI